MFVEERMQWEGLGGLYGDGEYRRKKNMRYVRSGTL